MTWDEYLSHKAQSEVMVTEVCMRDVLNITSWVVGYMKQNRNISYAANVFGFECLHTSE